MNLENFKPLIDTREATDEALELWYGSKFAVKFLRLIEGCEILEIDNVIFYMKNNNYMCHFIQSSAYSNMTLIYLSYENICIHLDNNFFDNYVKYQDLLFLIITKYFNNKNILVSFNTFAQFFSKFDNIFKITDIKYEVR